MTSHRNPLRMVALCGLAASLLACAATPSQPASTTAGPPVTGSASSSAGATSTAGASSGSSTSVTSTSSSSTASATSTTGSTTGTTATSGSTTSGTAVSSSSSSTTAGSSSSSTTSSSSSGSTGAGAACATCLGNADCASNSCYGGYCDPVGLTCTTNADCGSGTCAGDYCSCGGSSSGSTSTSTTTSTSSSSSGGSTGSTGGACVACSSNSACASNSCYGGYCDPVGLKCTSNTDCGTGTCKSNGYCSCGGSTTSSTTSSTSTSGGTTTGSTTTTGGTTSGTTTSGSTGSVTAQGGQVSTLFFAAVGDARPPNEDDTSNYPTAIISQIYQDITAMNPEFVVSTGDYMFANPSGTQGQAQIDLYAQARRVFPGVEFAAMGNHECTGYTSSNCLSTGSSNNYKAFMQTLIAPLGQTKPYYRFDVNDSNGQWTAKFIVLAMNSWDSTQANWLTTQMQQSTTYTFIIRHEPEAATTAPGVTPSDNIISQYPYTLKIVGHTHEFSHASTREVIVGNGGAPISYGDYGYALFSMTSNGDIQVQSMDYQSNAPVATFTVPK